MKNLEMSYYNGPGDEDDDGGNNSNDEMTEDNYSEDSNADSSAETVGQDPE